jgi:hypothetical protein
MADEEFWLPLVDEPIGDLVANIQEADPELAALAQSPRRQLAFRTFAYIRVGVLLGTLLVDYDVDKSSAQTWVEQLLADPRHRKAVEEEVRAVAREVSADPKLQDEEPVGPDAAARERFRRFAREVEPS